MAVLELAPDAPAYLRTTADIVLVLHIGGGSLGIVSGFAALAFRKGSSAHRAAGNIFFVAMLTMSAIGAIVSPMLHDRISATAGVSCVSIRDFPPRPENEKARRTFPAGLTPVRVIVEPSGRPVG